MSITSKIVHIFNIILEDAMPEDLTEAATVAVAVVVAVDNYKTCKNRALYYLGLKSHSSYSLQQKLLKKFDAQVVQQIIAECLEQNWLNDANFSEQLFYKYQSRGMNKIKQAFYQHRLSLKDYLDAMTHQPDVQKNSHADAPQALPNDFMQPLITLVSEYEKACMLWHKKFNHRRTGAAHFFSEESELLDDANHLHTDFVKNSPIQQQQQQDKLKIQAKQMRYLIAQGFDYQIAKKVVQDMN